MQHTLRFVAFISIFALALTNLGAQCNLPAPGNLNAFVTNDFARFKWSKVTGAASYQLIIKKIVNQDTTSVYSTILPDNIFIYTYEDIEPGQRYLVELKAQCANQLNSSAFARVGFSGIIIEDVVYMQNPGCNMDNNTCTNGVAILNGVRRNAGQSRSTNWLTATDMQVYNIVIRNGRNGKGAERSEFKLAKNSCSDSYLVREGFSNVYDMVLVGTGDSIKIINNATASLASSITVNSASFNIRAHDSTRVTLTRCDSCVICSGMSGTVGGGGGGGNSERPTPKLTNPILENSSFELQPNPSNGERVTITGTLTRPVQNGTVMLFNALGTKIGTYQQPITRDAGAFSYEWVFADILTTGSYRVVLLLENTTYTQTLIVK